MGQKIEIQLDHVGANNCIASTLDEGCCPMLRTSHFGRVWECQIWGKLEDDQGDGLGRLLRHSECIKATKNE